MGIISDLTVRISADTSGLMSGIGSASGALRGLTGSFGGLSPVVGIFAGMSVAAVGFAASSVSAAGDFQQSVSKIQAYAGLSAQATDKMKQSILDMSVQVGLKPKELSDALYPIISSGYSAAQSLDILRLSAETAASSGAKTSVVADALTTSLKAMHAPANQASMYMDEINKMCSLGKGEIPQYAAVIGKLSLSASSAGVDFQTMGATLATLTTHGFPSVAQASTALGNLYTQIGPKVDMVAQHAQKLGLSFDENAFKSMSFADKLNYLNKITDGNQGEMLKLLGGNSLALKSFNALEGSTKDFTANLEAMGHAQGTTSQVFAVASQNWNFSLQKLGAAFDIVKINVGDALLPVLTQLVNAFIPLIANIGNLFTSSSPLSPLFAAIGSSFKQLGEVFKSPEFQTMQSAFVGLGVTIGQVLMPVIKPLAQEFMSLFANQSVASGANGLKSAFAGIRDAVNGVTGFVQSLSGKFAELGSYIKPIIASFGNYANTIRTTFATIMQTVAPIIGGIINIVLQLAGYIMQALPSIYNIASQVMAGLGSVFKTVGPVITGSLIPAIQHLISVIGPVVVQIVQWIDKSGILPVIFNIIGLALKTMVQIIADNISRVTTVIQIIIVVVTAIVNSTIFAVNSIKNSWALVVGWVTAAVNAVRAVVMSIWNSIMSWWTNLTKSSTDNVHSTFSGIPAWLGSIWSNIQAGVQNAWNSVLNFFRNIFANIVSAISGAITTVVGWFQWLYNHNYYFQALCDFIRNVITSVITWLTDTWNNSVNWISQKWAMLSAYATTYWSMIQVEIQAKVQQVVSWLQGIWSNSINWISSQWSRLSATASSIWSAINAIIQNVVSQVVSFLQSKWSQLSQLAQNAWNAVTSVFRNAWGGISSALSGLWNNISGWFANLASTAVSWGANIINSVISGIQNAAGGISNAINGAINNALSGAGFHGLPGHAKGILNSPVGHLAIVGENGPELMYVPQGSSIYPNGTAPNISYGRSATAASTSSGNGEQHIHVHIGNSEVAHYVTNEQMKMVRLGGYRR